MKQPIIEIVYTCTGGYCNYADEFMRSLRYFFPDYRKLVRIISDGAERFRGYSDDNIIFTDVIQKPNLLYPCVPIHKMYWINEIPKSSCDYRFYFDADTIFKEVPDYNWGDIIDHLDRGYVMISYNPFFIDKSDGHDVFISQNILENTEKDPSMASYIDADEPYDYVITSFFGANSHQMRRICQRIVDMQNTDMRREKWYHIPKYIDENYFNRLVYDYKNGRSSEFKFLTRQFNEFYDNDNEPCSDVFMYQKNMKDYKFNRQ